MKKRSPKTPATPATHVIIEPSIRKKVVPRSAFKTGNQYAYQPGHTPANRAGSGPREMRLVSKSLRVQLACRCPDDVCRALGIPSHSSWAQALSMSLIKRAVRGDLTAASLIVQTTEGLRSQIELSSDMEAAPREVRVIFQASDGAGRVRTLPQTVDGCLADDPDPDPGVIYTPPEVAD